MHINASVDGSEMQKPVEVGSLSNKIYNGFFQTHPNGGWQPGISEPSTMLSFLLPSEVWKNSHQEWSRSPTVDNKDEELGHLRRWPGEQKI